MPNGKWTEGDFEKKKYKKILRQETKGMSTSKREYIDKKIHESVAGVGKSKNLSYGPTKKYAADIAGYAFSTKNKKPFELRRVLETKKQQGSIGRIVNRVYDIKPEVKKAEAPKSTNAKPRTTTYSPPTHSLSPPPSAPPPPPSRLPPAPPLR